MKVSRIPSRIRWAVSQLAVRPSDTVLEIGCGPGRAVGLICERLSKGTIVAIDRSALQVSRARAINRACLAAGRARVEQLELLDAPAALGERAFAKVFAINVNAFWTDPSESFASLSRLVRRGGRAYLFYEPPSASVLRRLQTAMRELLPGHGFAVEDVRSQRLGTGTALSIVARPGA